MLIKNLRSQMKQTNKEVVLEILKIISSVPYHNPDLDY
jgi:hypothetical protein